LDSAKPIFGIFLSSGPTQHLIASINVFVIFLTHLNTFTIFPNVFVNYVFFFVIVNPLPVLLPIFIVSFLIHLPASVISTKLTLSLPINIVYLILYPPTRVILPVETFSGTFKAD